MTFRRYLLPVVLLSLLFSSSRILAQPMERPTVEDRSLAHRYTALAAELNILDSPARELLNERPQERTQAYLDALNSKTEVSLWRLQRARRSISRLLSQLEEAKNLALPAPYFVAQRQSTITLDGKLEETDWQHALAMPIQYHRLEKVEGPHATVRLLWDETYLYAAFEVPDVNIIAPLIERDGQVWRTDCVELFLLPDRTARDYWELEISASGSVYDSLCHKYTDRWGSDMQVEKTMSGLQFGIDVRGTLDRHDDCDEGYTIEIAVPFKELPGFLQKPEIGRQLYALLCRVDRTNIDPEIPTTPLAQAPWPSWFHNIWAYQPLVLSAPGRHKPTGR